MITIYAEKPDMGSKIAAALDAVHLSNGTDVSFKDLNKHTKEISAQRARDGYLKIDRKIHGEDAIVTWGFGHLCGLKQAADYNKEYKNWSKIPLPFIPDYQLKLLNNGKDQYKKLKKMFASSSMILCATDDDREGDLIFDYLYRYMKCKTPYKRILFNKQTQEEFVYAFLIANPVSAKQRLPVVQAGRARSQSDFIVGANLTTALTLKCHSKDVLSVGRVQTAVLSMIVEREREIQNFKPEPYWTITGKFTTADNESYEGTHKAKRFFDKTQADVIMSNLSNTAVVTEVKKKEYTKSPPNLYSLQTLQMDANKTFGFTLDTTLNTAQGLYEKGFLTYPRTDSMFLTEDMGSEITRVLSMLFETPAYQQYKKKFTISSEDRRYFDNSKVESHYAIVPTSKSPSGLSDIESKIYDLVARSVICMTYPDAVLEKVNVTTNCSGEDFLSSGTSIKELGFYDVVGKPKESFLPNLSEQEIVSAMFRMDEKQTEPPKRYTDATLLNAMINCGKTLDDEELKAAMVKDGELKGLGRPSTQAAVVSTLESRQYIRRQKKTIIPTEKGMELIDVFPIEELKSPTMTARWEKRLDDIERGTDSYESFMRDIEQSVREWTNIILNMEVKGEYIMANTNQNQTNYICPFCGRPMNMYQWGLGCSGYADHSCSFSISGNIGGYNLTRDDLENLLNGKPTDIHEFTSKAGKKFSARLVLDRDQKKISYQFENKTYDDLFCPICGSPLKDVTWGFGCSAYSTTGCRFSIGSVGGIKLTHDQVKDLLAGKTIHLDGMTGKNGNKFNADISMCMQGDRIGKIDYHFPDNGNDGFSTQGYTSAQQDSQPVNDNGGALPWAE